MKKKAFSLIELLISLITISVILASLAPVVTHKLKHGGVSIGTKKLSMKCPSSVGADCTLCLGNQCIACPISCGNQFKNTLTCKCESCTQSNCGNCNSDRNKCDRCNDGYGLQSNGSCSACNAPYVSNGGSSGCIKCDTGYKYQNENLKTQCKECDTANGYFPNSDRKGCTQKTCSKGYKRSGSTCVACTGDTYQPNDNYSGTSCSNCGANSVANANHTGCTSTCVDKSTCTGNNYHDGCQCKPCGSGTQPNADKTSCDVITVTPTSCPDGKYLDNGVCRDCPEGCTKCSSAYACSECDTSSYFGYLLDGVTCKKYKYPTSQAICDELTAGTTIYVSGLYGGTGSYSYGFCMRKRNAGDEGGPSIDYDGVIEKHKAGDSNDKCTNDSGAKCCWYGYSGGYNGRTENMTAKSDICTTNPENVDILSSVGKFDYEGCNRTVCNWYAANYICTNIDSNNKKRIWGLPNEGQMRSIIGAIEKGPTSNTDAGAIAGTKPVIQKWAGSSGLQLCRTPALNEQKPYRNYSPLCESVYPWCYGAYSNKCAPSSYWGGSWTTQQANQSSGTVVNKEYKSGALSVRCILYKYIE